MSPELQLLAVVAFVAAAITILAVATRSSKNKMRDKLQDRVNEYMTLPVGTVAPSGPNDVGAPGTGLAREAPPAKALGRLATALTAAGMTIKPAEWGFICLGSGVLFAVIFFLLSGGSPPAVVVGLMLGVAGPLLLLKFKRVRRQRKFLDDLPDVLTSIASGLRAGASLPQSVAGTTEEASGVIGEELNRVMIEARLGTPIPDALDASALRMQCPDLEMVVMAIRLQSAHGGDLADLLTTVSATLRERVQMARHVRALSAEGRLSLIVLMALPLVVLAAMSIIRPEYFEFFIGTTLGYVVLFVGGTMMLVGYFWGRAIVKVEV